MDRLTSACQLKNEYIREFLAELLGTFILVFIGDAAVAQVVLSNGAKGDFFTINWGYGIAVMLGVMVSGGVSGGHLNPAVTVAMALAGKFPYFKIPIYMLAQYLGAFLASPLIYLVYCDALKAYDGGNRMVTGPMATAGIFATYPAPFLSAGIGLVDQIVGTGLLLIAILAITDDKNMSVPKHLIPLYVGLSLAAIGMSMGFNCGYAINPARDLAPRIFTLLAGWGTETFTHELFFWIPILGPHIGAILGALTYMLLVSAHWGGTDVDSGLDGEGPRQVKVEQAKN